MTLRKNINLRIDCNRYLARALIYLERGDTKSAQTWAIALQNRLVECGLLIAPAHMGGHNGNQSPENPETKAETAKR